MFFFAFLCDTRNIVLQMTLINENERERERKGEERMLASKKSVITRFEVDEDVSSCR